MLKKLNLQKKRQITKKKKSKVKKEHYKTLKLKPLSSKQIATQNEKKVKQKKQPNKRDTKKNICLIGPIASGKTTCASVINTDGYFVVPIPFGCVWLHTGPDARERYPQSFLSAPRFQWRGCFFCA